ncbi:MAG: aspartate aminotransferase family protein [Chloroherpetonaceae bacterium]|nr:aspartate aminotransferase family protein [Chloroherpetonaceae bacterium]MDW8437887.1 aspartate aminotransferase family protein [Chloroherpetonaceae bacterium]
MNETTAPALTLEREAELFFHSYARLPLDVVCGEGNYLVTRDGRKYLDMIAGIGVNALGYGNARVASAIAEQARKLIHASNLFLLEPQFKLAEKLLALTGFSKVFFCNSGAEANEGAMKLARKWAARVSPEKRQLLSLTNGFHGRTYGALTLTAKAKYHEGYEPLLPETGYIDFNDPQDLEKKVSDKTAAVFVEYVQGEGGICGLSQEFLEALDALRAKHNFLIVADEVQAGVGRTGKFFSYQHFNVAPDVICAAKPLGGGLPLGAIIGNERVADVFTKGVHGTTFGGNPVACAAGLALIEELEAKDLMRRAAELGAFFKAELVRLMRKHIQIRAARQYGLMIGVSTSREASYYVSKMLEKGVIINATNGNVIRLLPPLTITESEILQVVAALDEVFSAEWRST